MDDIGRGRGVNISAREGFSRRITSRCAFFRRAASSMDVRCERCRAQYVFDDEQVTPSGLTVQCTNCRHLFRVKKKELVVTVPVRPEDVEGTPLPATAAAPRGGGRAPEPAREWRIRQTSGEVFTFRELTTLQKWIVEGKVARDDELSHSGEAFRRLGDIGDLAAFFSVVEAAERGRAAADVATAPLPLPTVVPHTAAPSGDAGLAVDVEVDLADEASPAPDRGRGRLVGAVALGLAALFATGAAAYRFRPELFVARGPEPVEVPIRIGAAGAAKATAAPASLPGPSPIPTVDATPTADPVRAAALATEPLVAEPLPTAAPAPPPPSDPKALLAEARALQARGRHARAAELFGRVIETEPRNLAALAGRGLSYLELERYAPAEASYKAALEVDPENGDALLGLAETYRWQGRRKDAIKYYESYLAAHPGGEDALAARNAVQQLVEE
jgi:predicted Zn finger-like uncharacterized protein